MAEQLEFFPVPSPCRGIGCLRSRDERFHWMKFSDAQKRDVLRLCHQRRLRLLRQQKPEDDAEPQQPSLF